jgi:hypothetical protein
MPRTLLIHSSTRSEYPAVKPALWGMGREVSISEYGYPESHHHGRSSLLESTQGVVRGVGCGSRERGIHARRGKYGQLARVVDTTPCVYMDDDKGIRGGEQGRVGGLGVHQGGALADVSRDEGVCAMECGGTRGERRPGIGSLVSLIVSPASFGYVSGG